MWSPKVNSNGAYNQFYENMTLTRPGDLVFSFADTLIKTVGVVSSPAQTADKPEEFGKAGEAWDRDGWLVKVDYDQLTSPIKPKDHIDVLAPLLPEKYSPIKADGGGNQVYLAEIPADMAEAMLSLLGEQVVATVEQGQEKEIQNRTDIGVTERYQLSRSRVGQGQYRKNLEQFESGCRITGITDKRFLTASHIKPWSKSNDFEKLDGNNGLLLSPHIDRLFDRGFISFENDGKLKLNSSLPKDVVSAWGLNEGQETKPLNNYQAKYMEYHRREIFNSRLHE